ncbi:GGDEF domain-containing protein [Halovibrio salipaludis]|uniref:diguanylate cyclase n=1 Tax=Halovibrio salipaludis TaxID=2032626 RepID=A0A2A2F422_9GAMM|nr:GGDEF domain-containing protein [Halovibrio salipaludis]PAU79698.1 GGDEF domain-containing protein [Halovibrio salipaludis]
MIQTLKLHSLKWLCIALYLPFSLAAATLVGTPRGWRNIDWLDVFGEGGGALMVLAWTLLILGSRPAGTVSNLIFAGLGLIFVSLWQDNIDEFWIIPDAQLWDTWLENVPMPIGVVILTLGLIRWYQEQRILMAQLSKRERFRREHRSVDPVTRLASADYLEQQLDVELRAARRDQAPVSLLLLDVDGFDRINRRHGVAEGDRLLQALTDLLLLNLRDGDLMCRYGGDRFAIMLPHTNETMAVIMAGELTAAVSHFAYHTHYEGERVRLTASVGLALALSDSPRALMQRADHALADAKQKGAGSHASAA